MNRFNAVILEICDLNQSTMMAMMMDGLLKNDLKRSLIKTYLRDFLDMLAHAEKYARMEEAFADDLPASSIAAGSTKECSPKWREKIRRCSQFLEVEK